MSGSREEDLKKLMQFHYMTYTATPQHKNPCPGCHEVYNFGRPFLAPHYHILGLSDLCQEVEKEIFKEIMHFQIMTYMIMPCPGAGVYEIYNFGRLFLIHHYHILGSFNQCE